MLTAESAKAPGPSRTTSTVSTRRHPAHRSTTPTATEWTRENARHRTSTVASTLLINEIFAAQPGNIVDTVT